MSNSILHRVFISLVFPHPNPPPPVCGWRTPGWRPSTGSSTPPRGSCSTAPAACSACAWRCVAARLSMLAAYPLQHAGRGTPEGARFNLQSPTASSIHYMSLRTPPPPTHRHLSCARTSCQPSTPARRPPAPGSTRSPRTWPFSPCPPRSSYCSPTRSRRTNGSAWPCTCSSAGCAWRCTCASRCSRRRPCSGGRTASWWTARPSRGSTYGPRSCTCR